LKTLRPVKKFTKKPAKADERLPRGMLLNCGCYFFGVSTGFLSGAGFVLTLPPTGDAPGLVGDAAGEAEGEANGLAAGLAVAIGDGVVVAGLFGTLLLGLLLQAPSAAVAARTELIMNDLLIVFLMCPLRAKDAALPQKQTFTAG